MAITLGNWITYSAKLFKNRVHGQTTWGRVKVAPGRGLIIGIRTVASGSTEWGDYDEWWWSFAPTKHHRVYLIVNDIYRKPFHVLVEDVALDEDRSILNREMA